MEDSLLYEESQSDGPWVFGVPDALTASLASLDDSAIANVVREWGATEEFVMDNWPTEQVTQYLSQLAAHARVARSQGRSLLLWT